MARQSMVMAMPAASAAATAGGFHFAGGLAAGAAALGRDAGGKHRESLGELLGPAMGAGGAFPVRGPDQHFAIGLTFVAMKLVYRHD